jgi:hypothetical protein
VPIRRNIVGFPPALLPFGDIAVAPALSTHAHRIVTAWLSLFGPRLFYLLHIPEISSALIDEANFVLLPVESLIGAGSCPLESACPFCRGLIFFVIIVLSFSCGDDLCF